MRWLNNLIHGKVVKEDKVSRQERKQAFRKKFKKQFATNINLI
jgi:hypothetical protein